jgi:2-polyprenyl-6-methoxyphenol hydroxylase-like FAD-dependent oxidoreductase
VLKVLIVGGGVGGMTAAIALRREGVAVDLIDADPAWRVYGAGISVTGISLRAFEALGVLDEVRARGFVSAGMKVKTAAGELQMSFPVADNPATVERGGGILRPVLHDILSTKVRASGADVRLGLRVETIAQDPDGVDVTFGDGSFGRYDLVVGADGIFSQIRNMIFPDAPAPVFTGQGCWRVVAPRPADVDRPEMYFGGPVKLGLNPVSRDEMYMFILEHVPGNPWFEPGERLAHLQALMAPFGGNAAGVRDGLTAATEINYRPLEWLLLPDPWYVGRVLLIGDAVHATTPHMASGAGIAAEDGLVLAEELRDHDDVAAALRAFMAPLFEGPRLVVDNSVRIGEMEMSGQSMQGNMMIGRTMHELMAPY